MSAPSLRINRCPRFHWHYTYSHEFGVYAIVAVALGLRFEWYFGPGDGHETSVGERGAW